MFWLWLFLVFEILNRVRRQTARNTSRKKKSQRRPWVGLCGPGDPVRALAMRLTVTPHCRDRGKPRRALAGKRVAQWVSLECGQCPGSCASPQRCSVPQPHLPGSRTFMSNPDLCGFGTLGHPRGPAPPLPPALPRLRPESPLGIHARWHSSLRKWPGRNTFLSSSQFVPVTERPRAQAERTVCPLLPRTCHPLTTW